MLTKKDLLEAIGELLDDKRIKTTIENCQLFDACYNMEWREIKRDRFGFAEDDCLDLIYHQLPVVVKRKGWLITDLACKDNWGKMRGEIEMHPYYTHYYKVPELPIEEDEE